MVWFKLSTLEDILLMILSVYLGVGSIDLDISPIWRESIEILGGSFSPKAFLFLAMSKAQELSWGSMSQSCLSLTCLIYDNM